MADDPSFIRHWLVEQARDLSRQQEEIRKRLEAIRAVMRFVGEHDPLVKRPCDEVAP